MGDPFIKKLYFDIKPIYMQNSKVRKKTSKTTVAP